MNLFVKHLSLVFASTALLASTIDAAVIRGYDSARHDRFDGGTFPTTPTESGTFWQSAHDWSGVGWQKTFTGAPSESEMGVTMISDIHFVGASHFNPGTFNDQGNADPSDDTGVVSFLGKDGIVYDYQVSNIQFLTTNYFDMGMPATSASDFMIGTLSAPINTTQITSYKILGGTSFADFIGVDLLHYGKTGTVGTGQIDNITLANIVGRITATYRSNFVADDMDPTATDDDLRFIGGDSGSPSFYEKNGELILSGIHSGINGPPTTTDHENFDAFAYYYLPEITAALAADGRTAVFEAVIPVPEPSSLLLTGLGSFLLLRRRRA